MKAKQIIQSIVYLITMLNTVLTAAGVNPLPFSENEIYIWVSLIVAVGVFIYGVWKNYSVTPEAKTADKVMAALKQGLVNMQDVLNLVENGATGGYASAMLFNGKNRVTQIYGGDHGGIDIVGDDDKNVHSVCDGTVFMISKWDGRTKTGTQSYGNLIIIKDSTGKRFYYAHLSAINVFDGQVVKTGDIIGVMGNTGNSFGAHTHFEIRTGTTTSTRINPSDYCGVENVKGTYIKSENPDITYQTFSAKKWLPWVTNHNDTNSNGYAGVENETISGVRAKTSIGNIRYRVHTIGGKWLPWVTDYNTSNSDGYAGIYNKNIDMIQAELINAPGYAIEYRVSTNNSTGYLDWVRNYNNDNDSGYAGVKGRAIDKLQMRIVGV